jgi:hypothetical protein
VNLQDHPLGIRYLELVRSKFWRDSVRIDSVNLEHGFCSLGEWDPPSKGIHEPKFPGGNGAFYRRTKNKASRQRSRFATVRSYTDDAQKEYEKEPFFGRHDSSTL